MRKKGFTLIELLVVIAIIAMLLAILMPALSKVKKIAQRVVCATHLKGLGTAQIVYANDYDDDYAVQGRGAAHTWSDGTGYWDTASPDWTSASSITVGASLYLLVREADVSPQSFVCPSGDEEEFSGTNGSNLDFVELWDFGHPAGSLKLEGPVKCVSYSYHQPYVGTGNDGTVSPYAANGTRSASFAMMGDKNPWFDSLTQDAPSVTNFFSIIALLPDPGDGQYETLQKWQLQAANAKAHSREGQNVVYGDGHASFEKRPDVGMQNDNVYTHFMDTDTGSENYRRVGDASQIKAEFASKGMDDSVLVNDQKTP